MIEQYLTKASAFPFRESVPWETIAHLSENLGQMLETLTGEYIVSEGVAVHRTAVVGHNVTIKAPAIISENCFVGSNSYLRGEGKVQWTFSIASAEKQPSAVAFCPKQKPADSNTAGLVHIKRQTTNDITLVSPVCKY